ncbi:sensor histidine kinase [Proteiniclasticum sp. SCR006]|uniref:histidine kinase n=1 Tax=Proteiniclasticum aestuarii TaxID=2817862 RepID=A0A939KL07_9CLOT|nr:sensor histidine kinase [Proteiniclasticum aestuarii]MBO1265185.1 sensor histidine kinase [Proteiniclasticum aestuarii]
MKKLRSSFFAKLFVTYLLVAMIPLLLISALLYGFSERIFRNNIEEEASTYLMEVSRDVDALYGYYEQAVSLLSRDPLVMKILSEQEVSEEETRNLYEKMYYLFSGRTTTMSLYILGMDGKTLFQSDVVPRHYNTRDYINWGVLRKASSEGEEIVFHPAGYRERTENDKVLTAAKAVKMEETLKGFILVDVQREEISKIIHGKTQGNIWEVMLLNDIGNVLYSKIRRENEAKPYIDAEKLETAEAASGFLSTVEEESFHTSFRKSRAYPYQLISYSSLNDVKSNASYLLRTLGYIGLLTLVISLLVAYKVSKSVSGAVKDLVYYMKKVEKGDFSERFPVERTDEIGELMQRYNKMAKRLDILISNIIESKDRLKKSEMKMLQSQINPHFLYNTLDTVKWMAKMQRTEEVSSLITNLATLLRISMEDAEEFQTVRQSIQWLESYLSIQKARYDDDLTYDIQVEEALMDHKIPKLILQPLVENAILHGVEGKGNITVTGYREEESMIFEVKDDGVGIEEKVALKLLEEGPDKGIGLTNVHRRIELLYGRGYGVRIFSEVSRGTTIRIAIPERGPVL